MSKKCPQEGEIPKNDPSRTASGIQDSNAPALPTKTTDTECLGYDKRYPLEQQDVEHVIRDHHTDPISMPGSGESQNRLSDSGKPVVVGEPNDEAIELEYLRQASSSTGISSYVDLGSSSGSSQFSIFEERRCAACRLLMKDFCCETSKTFWMEVDPEGPDYQQSCHIKFFEKFIEKLKDKFQQEEGLKSRCTINLLKQLLKVDLRDKTAGLRLADLNRVIELFGPIRADGENCVLIHQLHDIVKRSLKARERGKAIKSSWFVGDMSRDEAERVLLDKDCKDKTYLVRISGTDGDEGDFVLSVRHEDHCHHLKIKGNPKESLKSVPYHAHLNFAGREFQSLPDVVDYISQNNEIKIEQDENTECEDKPCTSVICLRVFSKSPLNGTMTGYEKAKR